MKFLFLKQNLDASRATIAFTSFCLLMSCVANIVFAMAFLKMIGHERTVIVPPTINKTFWVDNEKVSGDYLEQMAAFAGYLSLNVAPSTVDYQNKVLLTYVCPGSYGAFELEGRSTAERIRRDNASQLFLPRSITVDEATLRVALPGSLLTMVNTTQVSNVNKTFLAEFEYRGGKICVKPFTEANPDDPFKPVPIKSAAASGPLRN